MAPDDSAEARAARAVPPEAFLELVTSANESVLRGLIENPALDETHVCLLLERKDLSGLLLEEISKRKEWRASYRVRLGLAAHPRTPRLIAMRLLRELHLLDLVRVSLLPSSSMELRRLADERVLAQLPQLPLGQRLMLARRGSARVAAGLVAAGPEQVARVALDNSFLTEAQLLKALAKETVAPRILGATAKHPKWSKIVNVRVALLRHSHLPADVAPLLVTGLPRRDMEDLVELSRLRENIRALLRKELKVLPSR
jgi:hypothetical protein